MKPSVVRLYRNFQTSVSMWQRNMEQHVRCIFFSEFHPKAGPKITVSGSR